MIRDMTGADVPEVLSLARLMHAESRFASRFPFDEHKVHGMLAHAIESDAFAAWVADDSDQLAGGFVGLATEQWFSAAIVAQDLAMFVRPERRGACVGVQFVERFKAWARERGAVACEIGVNTGVAPGRTGSMLKACGMTDVGTLYSMEF